MKKWIVFILTLCLALGVTACGSSDENSNGASQGGSHVASESAKTDKPASYVQIKGVTLSLGAELTEEDRSALGEPDEVLEAPSCHYDGSDRSTIIQVSRCTPI